jgi:hypothetical protein
VEEPDRPGDPGMSAPSTKVRSPQVISRLKESPRRIRVESFRDRLADNGLVLHSLRQCACGKSAKALRSVSASVRIAATAGNWTESGGPRGI